MLSNNLRLNFCYLKTVQILHPRYHPKIIGRTLKSKQKNKYVYIHEINHNEHGGKKEKMKHKYDMNGPKYKMFLIMIILICTKQQLSNIWSIHEKVKQHGC